MNKTIICVLALLLVFGCLSQQPVGRESPLEPPRANQTAIDGIPVYIRSVQWDENLSVVELSSYRVNNEPKFQVLYYKDQFTKLGIHSDSFIKLETRHLAMLDENETIWITPMVHNNSGVLLNVIYSREIDNCSAASIEILGKNYRLKNLKNTASFNNDDKWKVLLDYNGNCLKRVVITMDGYFYDIKDGQQINLFRNDNTILLAFTNIATDPKIRVVATKPQSNVTFVNTIKNGIFNFVIGDAETGVVYNELMTIDGTGIKLSFSPAIPETTCDRVPCEKGYRVENHGMEIIMPNGEWGIATMKNKTDFIIGKDPEGVVVAAIRDNISIAGTNWTFDNYTGYDNVTEITVRNTKTNETKIVKPGEWTNIGKRDLRIWGWNHGYAGELWIFLSSFTELIDLSNKQNNVTLGWGDGEIPGYPVEDSTLQNGTLVHKINIAYNGTQSTLESIFIPRSSPIFENLQPNN